MSKVITLLFLLIVSSALAQSTKSKGDDSFLDPEPDTEVEKENDKKKEKNKKIESEEHEGKRYDAGTVKDLPKLNLPNFDEGSYNHYQVLQFCKNIIDQLDNTERRKDKIISISIKGFADGLVNKGMKVTKDEVHPECAKFVDWEGGQEDIQLATLRACQIEGLLRDLLRGKSYNIFVNFSHSYYDEPDGGNSGGEYRKVEVQVSYLDRNK